MSPKLLSCTRLSPNTASHPTASLSLSQSRRRSPRPQSAQSRRSPILPIPAVSNPPHPVSFSMVSRIPAVSNPPNPGGLCRSKISFKMHLSWRRRADESLDLPLLGDGDGDKEAMPRPRRKTRVPVKVGAGWERQKRFLVPLDHTAHPLFLGLLNEAEEELGFDHQRPGFILLPCSIERFRQIRDTIEQETGCEGRCGSSHCHCDHRLRLRLRNFLSGCFRA